MMMCLAPTYGWALIALLVLLIGWAGATLFHQPRRARDPAYDDTEHQVGGTP